MYRIALCDGDKNFCEAQEKLCREILERHGIEHSVTVYNNGADFYKAFSAGERYDLILTETVKIGKESMKGIELARMIREADREADIVFITSDYRYAVKGYEAGALRYLIKPVDANALERLITEIYKDKFQDRYFILKTGKVSHRIAVKDIISLKTAERKVEITLNGGEALYFPGKLTELLKELPDRRVKRCHQAHAVNIGGIRELTYSKAVTVNGTQIPVSRPYQKDIQAAFYTDRQNIT